MTRNVECVLGTCLIVAAGQACDNVHEDPCGHPMAVVEAGALGLRP